MNLILSKKHLFTGIIFQLLLLSHTTAQTKTDTTRQWGKDTVKLKEVVIKATRKIYIEQQPDRTIVNVHALPSNAGISAVDVLNNTPGIMVDDNGNISIKGKEHALVYIDDKPAYLTGKELLNYLQSLPSGMLDKIEIMPIPPARYTAAGSAGIILIRTKKNNLYGFNGNLALNYGQGIYPKSNNSFNVNYRTGIVNLYGMFSYSLQKNYYDVWRDRVYRFPNSTGDYSIQQDINEHNQREAASYKLGLDIDLDKQTTVGFFAGKFTSPYKENGSYVNSFTSAKTDSVLYSASDLHTYATNHSLNLNILRRFAKTGKELSFNLDYLTMNSQSNQVLASRTFINNNGSWQNDNTLISSNPFRVNIYSASADYTTPLAEKTKLGAGLQSTYSTRESIGDYIQYSGSTSQPAGDLNNRFHFREHISAAYISLQKQSRCLSWQVGLRMEHTFSTAVSGTDTKPDSSFTIGYTDIFPTAYMQYKFDSSSRHTLNISFGKRITRPGYQDYNPSIFFFNRYTYTTGNSLLQPQYAYGIELSYSYTRLFTVGLLYNRTNNIITQAYQQLNDVLVTTTLNIDQSSSFGINSTGSMQLTRRWSLNLYQELTSTRYRGILFSADDRLDKNLVGYRLTLGQQFSLGKGWGADITAIYRSNILYGQAIIKTAWQVHAGLQKKCGERVMFTFSARDIFRSWVFERDIFIPNAAIRSVNRNDTRFIGITFNYRFGGTAANRERKSGIQTEAGRAGIGG